MTQSPVTTLTNTPDTFFGDVVVIDDPLTVGPEPNSKIVGRAQGIYAGASLSEIRLLMTLNYVFVEGKYNGSTLSILGSNPVFSKVREMPIVGGSGLFRFACGYALAKTYSFNTTSGDAVVEYNVDKNVVVYTINHPNVVQLPTSSYSAEKAVKNDYNKITYVFNVCTDVYSFM
ncbi:hypothetical protein L1987_84167 [Smallanthus sonchifolius]|uniref:Uncharacterized protein n=1 Tax=Smallanthus sonchifolius TaxID=185202 RepID=A0ACB8YDZ5_9ASTR|nr:hypothetical protein L1987_84167 [Smallanthus sonchifolius]